MRRICESFLKLVAIATVADVVPLTGENRVIVRTGCAGSTAVRNPGLRALLDVAGFTGEVGAQLRGRSRFRSRRASMPRAAWIPRRAVVELFLTSDAARARDLAKQLHDQNDRAPAGGGRDPRDLRADRRDDGECALVYYAEDWHRGVLGIVASRLVERFHRPVFVLGRNDEDGMASGSGRSIPAFHLLDALESMPDLFVTVRRARACRRRHAWTRPASAEFRERFNAYAGAPDRAEDFPRRVEIDAVLDLREIDDAGDRASCFSLAPFGHGNPSRRCSRAPTRKSPNARAVEGEAPEVTVRQNGRTLALKAWNFAERLAEMPAGARVDIAFPIEEDAWSAARGYSPWCAVLRDVRAAAVGVGA